MANFTKEYRKQSVAQFREEWESEKISMQSYAKRIAVHHTTFRKWVAEYDPELRRQALYTRNSVSSAEPNRQIKVVSERYQYDEFEAADLAVDQTLLDELNKKVIQLESENSFLRRCVAYWTHQAVPEVIV